MVCCKPAICCGETREEYKAKDDWYCGFGCLNGVPQITMALFLVFAGFCFSLATLGDCRFALIDDGFIPSLSNRFPIFNDDAFALRRGVGFVTFEKPGGGCYFYDNGLVNQEDLVRFYVNWLGSDWNAGRSLAATTPFISLLVWIYLWSFTCTAQVRACRYTVAGILCVVLTTLQGITFTALTSGWCDENACEFSRSSGFSVGALLCFFFSGLGLFLTWDYPGGAHGGAAAAVASKGEPVQEEEEDPEQAVVVEKGVNKEDQAAPEEQAPAQDEDASEGNDIEEFVDAVVDESKEIEAEA